VNDKSRVIGVDGSGEEEHSEPLIVGGWMGFQTEEEVGTSRLLSRRRETKGFDCA